MGSAAAARAALDGRRVALVEASTFGHESGSSHGESRIIRRTYPSTLYTALMQRVYPMWTVLEAAAGEQIYTRTGGVDIVRVGSTAAESLLKACDVVGVDVRVLTSEETRARLGFTLGHDQVAVEQEDTGTLNASAGVAAMQRVAVQYGARLTDNFKVEKLHDRIASDELVEAVSVDGRRVRARSVVIAVGPWATSFLRATLGINIKLSVVQVSYAYYRAASEVDDTRLRSLGVFIDYGSGAVPWTSTPQQHATSQDAIALPDSGDPCVYSCPSSRLGHDGRALIKIGLHAGVVTTAEGRSFIADVEKKTHTEALESGKNKWRKV